MFAILSSPIYSLDNQELSLSIIVPSKFQCIISCYFMRVYMYKLSQIWCVQYNSTVRTGLFYFCQRTKIFTYICVAYDETLLLDVYYGRYQVYSQLYKYNDEGICHWVVCFQQLLICLLLNTVFDWEIDNTSGKSTSILVCIITYV